MIALNGHGLIGYGLVVAAAGCALFLLTPYLSGDIKAEKRRDSFAVRTKRGGDRVNDAANRRKQVAGSLKEIDQRQKARKATLETRLGQAGLDWSRGRFYAVSAALAVALGAALLVFQGNPLVALAGAFAAGFGLPSWWLGLLGRRRLAKFVDAFPGAVDVVVRGIRAGLPLGDCLRVVAAESPEPLRSEFRLVVETQSMGLSLAEAVERMAVRVPATEINFFAIVIGIQAKAGGNLSEALGNLSVVIRERKKMKMKVKAISSEAKASAAIIGSLPFAVGIMVYVISPDYISLLWTTSTGRVAMGLGAAWMTTGIVVMRKMINFRI